MANIVGGWSNKIFLKTWPEGNRTTTEFNIGTTFDQVHYSNTNGFTLANLSNFLKKFFNSQMFMRYCGKEPASYKIMEWYEVIPADNATEDEIKVVNDNN